MPVPSYVKWAHRLNSSSKMQGFRFANDKIPLTYFNRTIVYYFNGYNCYCWTPQCREIYPF